MNQADTSGARVHWLLPASVRPASAPALLKWPSRSGAGFGDLHSPKRVFRRKKILDFEAECKKVRAMLSALGSLALELASENADQETRNRNPQGGAYWQHVTALIAALLPGLI